jgi:hypothetical protein
MTELVRSLRRRADRRKTPAVVAAALSTGLAIAASAFAQAPEPSTRAAVQRALTEFRSGLRHSDGELACSRMTLRLRQQLLAVWKRETSTTGLGCEAVIEIYGSQIYDPNSGRTIRTVVFDGARARACTTTGGRANFVRERGRWRLDRAAERRC